MQELEEREPEPQEPLVIRQAIEAAKNGFLHKYTPRGYIHEFDLKQPKARFIRAWLLPAIYRLDFYSSIIGGSAAGLIADKIGFIPDHALLPRPFGLTIFAVGCSWLSYYLGRKLTNRMFKPTGESTLFRS